MAFEAELEGQLRRAPAKRDPAAPVAVIVDQPLVAERFGTNHEALASEGPQPCDGADQSTWISVNPRERRTVGGALRPDGRAARKQRGGTGGKTSTVEQHAARLAALGLRLQSSRPSAGRS